MGVYSGPFSSFVAYAGDPLVSLTLIGLILVGGAGFLVWDDLVRNGLRWRRYRLQTKIVLFVNLVLWRAAGWSSCCWSGIISVLESPWASRCWRPCSMR